MQVKQHYKQQATTLAGQGVGSYQPFLTSAGQAGTAAGTALGAADTTLGTAGTELTGAGTALGTASSTIGGASPFISAAQTGLGTAAGLTGTGTGTGTGSIASYMSPYQSQVIDATLADYDFKRIAAQRSGVTQQAGLGTVGNLDSGRFGVQLGAFDAQTARDRALVEANLLQQGFGQASGARQQDFANQVGLATRSIRIRTSTSRFRTSTSWYSGTTSRICWAESSFAGAQQGLGQGQLGLGQFQQGLGSSYTSRLGLQDVSGFGSSGRNSDQAQGTSTVNATTRSKQISCLRTYGKT